MPNLAHPCTDMYLHIYVHSCATTVRSRFTAASTRFTRIFLMYTSVQASFKTTAAYVPAPLAGQESNMSAKKTTMPLASMWAAGMLASILGKKFVERIEKSDEHHVRIVIEYDTRPREDDC